MLWVLRGGETALQVLLEVTTPYLGLAPLVGAQDELTPLHMAVHSFCRNELETMRAPLPAFVLVCFDIALGDLCTAILTARHRLCRLLWLVVIRGFLLRAAVDELLISPHLACASHTGNCDCGADLEMLFHLASLHSLPAEVAVGGMDLMDVDCQSVRGNLDPAALIRTLNVTEATALHMGPQVLASHGLVATVEGALHLHHWAVQQMLFH